MIRLTSIALALIGIASFTFAQGTETLPQSEPRPSFESLKTQAERYIAAKAEDMRRLELMVAETEARTRKASKEIAEYDRHLEDQLQILQFVRERLSHSHDGGVILVGNRRYPQSVVEENLTARCEEIANSEHSRETKADEVEGWTESIRRQKDSLNRVRAQLSKAKAVLGDQETRRERAAQELAVSEVVQQTCPQGDLLFASNTELGRILGDIEIVVCTLEAILDMRKSKVEVDLSDVREAKQYKEKGTEQ